MRHADHSSAQHLGKTGQRLTSSGTEGLLTLRLERVLTKDTTNEGSEEIDVDDIDVTNLEWDFEEFEEGKDKEGE